MGGEIGDFPAQEQDLLVQRRDETRHRHPLVRRYLFEDAPKHLLKAQARALAVEPDRPRLEGVAVRGLACKKLAMFPPSTGFPRRCLDWLPTASGGLI